MLSGEEGWLAGKGGLLHYWDGKWEIFDNPLNDDISALIMLSIT
jgi:hypothetical protein